MTDAICLCTNWIPQASHTPSTQAHKNLWTTWVDVLSALETNTASQQQNNCFRHVQPDLNSLQVNLKAARLHRAAFVFCPAMLLRS